MSSARGREDRQHQDLMTLGEKGAVPGGADHTDHFCPLHMYDDAQIDWMACSRSEQTTYSQQVCAPPGLFCSGASQKSGA